MLSPKNEAVKLSADNESSRVRLQAAGVMKHEINGELFTLEE
jgi:hypothetical protein